MSEPSQQAKQRHAGIRERQVDRFLAECCVTDPLAMISSTDLSNLLADWASRNRLDWSMRSIGVFLRARGMERVKTGHSNTWHWIGLRAP